MIPVTRVAKDPLELVDEPITLKFGPADTLIDEIARRTNTKMPPPRVVKRDLDRYYDLLSLMLERLKFTEPEARILVNHARHVGKSNSLVSEVEDRISTESPQLVLDKDVESLTGKLRKLTPPEDLAVRDAVERYWSRDDLPANPRMDEISFNLRRVGLFRDPKKPTREPSDAFPRSPWDTR
jgi:hypothetical protein